MSGQQQGGGAPPAGDGQGQGQGQGDGEAARVKSLDDRFGAIEAKQREQDTVLERIAAAVGAGGGGRHAAGGDGAGEGGGAPAPAAGGLSIAEQVRREIAEADQRRKKEEDEATWRAGVTEAVEKVKAESQPRPPQTGVIATARRLVLGKGWDA